MNVGVSLRLANSPSLEGTDEKTHRSLIRPHDWLNDMQTGRDVECSHRRLNPFLIENRAPDSHVRVVPELIRVRLVANEPFKKKLSGNAQVERGGRSTQRPACAEVR